MNTPRSSTTMLPEHTDLDTLNTPGVYRQAASLPTPPPPVALSGAYVISRIAAQQEAVWQLTLQRFAAEVGKSLAQVAEVVERAFGQCVDAGIVAEIPPTEPRERALWAQRNRGTGPTTSKAWHKR